tara:strand:+ start:1322 stop:1603 length:282 start_codon:yes stop_codon:yes gene_type:complete
MKYPKKIEPIKPNYHEDDAISLLERWFDEWSKDEDWWNGNKTWDLNIFTEHDAEEFKYGSRWVINVYGLVKYDDDELLHIDTSNEIDVFELKL